MTEDLLLKVVCGSCGKLIGKVVDHDRQIAYRMIAGPATGLNVDPATIWCIEHGWPDLASEEVAAKLTRARTTGKPATHRARCGPPTSG
jgi:hypothetical protein